MLAEISFETEFRIHEITMLLFLFHEDDRCESASSGFVMDPSIKPILFLAERAMIMALLQEA